MPKNANAFLRASSHGELVASKNHVVARKAEDGTKGNTRTMVQHQLYPGHPQNTNKLAKAGPQRPASLLLPFCCTFALMLPSTDPLFAEANPCNLPLRLLTSFWPLPRFVGGERRRDNRS